MYKILAQLDKIETLLDHRTEPTFRGKKRLVKREDASYSNYSTERQQLDLQYNKYNVRRGTMVQSPLFWKNEIEDDGRGRRLTKTSKPTHVKMADRVKVRREFVQNAKVIPHTKSWLDTYEIIDQGPDGACSLVGFLNYCIIMNVKLKYNEASLDTPSDARGNWAYIWLKLDPYKNDGMFMDIASVLDALFATGLKLLKDTQQIHYFPVRSIGNFESKFNPELTSDGSLETILAKIDEKIMGILGRGIPVLINSNEHTTVCVGFDAESYYFADSWGDGLLQDEWDMQEALVCSFKAGVSRVPKSFIVSYVRDMAWIE